MSQPSKAKSSRVRQLEIISTDSDSSLGTLSSMNSPQTAWKRNHENVTQLDFKHKTLNPMHKSGAASLGKNPEGGLPARDRKQESNNKAVLSKSVPPSRLVLEIYRIYINPHLTVNETEHSMGITECAFSIMGHCGSETIATWLIRHAFKLSQTHISLPPYQIWKI